MGRKTKNLIWRCYNCVIVSAKWASVGSVILSLKRVRSLLCSVTLEGRLLPDSRVGMCGSVPMAAHSPCTSRECGGFQDTRLSCQQDCSVPPCIWEVVEQQDFSLSKTAVGNNTICVLITTISAREGWPGLLLLCNIQKTKLNCWSWSFSDFGLQRLLLWFRSESVTWGLSPLEVSLFV